MTTITLTEQTTGKQLILESDLIRQETIEPYDGGSEFLYGLATGAVDSIVRHRVMESEDRILGLDEAKG